MNALAGAAAPSPRAGAGAARIALLGTGTVGRAVLARLAGWADTERGARLQLVHVANSRVAFQPVATEWRQAPAGAMAQRWREGVVRITGPVAARDERPGSADAPAYGLQGWRLAGLQQGLDIAMDALGDHGPRIVIDATASDALAGHHATWLARGVDVVTACKLGQGASLARWRAIQAGCMRGATNYGDSATVGAGLPALRSIRELRAGGDTIHAVAGVLSGSLAWLFNHYDGLHPFSALVREARDAGYTEPDPRDDLSGEDVRRKVLILARAAGVVLEAGDVDVDSLVPHELASCCPEQVDAALSSLDAPLFERHAAAGKEGARLRFIARIEVAGEGKGKASVGLESLAAEHPLAGGAGTDNRIAIWSDRYCDQPLLIQGPGAGPGLTAAALLDDALRIAGRRW